MWMNATAGGAAALALAFSGAVGCVSGPAPQGVDKVLMDADLESDSQRISSEDLSKLRWRANELARNPWAPNAARELALVDTWLAAASAMSIDPDRDEEQFVLLVQAISGELAQVQAWFKRLEVESELERSRAAYVAASDRAVSPAAKDGDQ